MKDERYMARLEQAVIDQIESDYRNEDYSAISELLRHVPTDELEAYLSDWRFEELEKEFDSTDD